MVRFSRPSQCDRPRDGAFARSVLVARIAITAERIRQ